MREQKPEEYLKREIACAQLGLKERRLRDYVNAGKIRQVENSYNAADVMKLAEERGTKKTTSQLRALATLDPLRAPQLREQLALLQPGNALPLPSCAWLTIDQAAHHTGLPGSVLLQMIE